MNFIVGQLDKERIVMQCDMCYKRANITFMLGMSRSFYHVKKKHKDDNFPIRNLLKYYFI